MSTHDRFLLEIEEFLEAANMRPTTFGLKAVNDAKFVSKLRGGSDVTTRTMDRVREFIISQKPQQRRPKRRAEARYA
jgi:hypothetical protein